MYKFLVFLLVLQGCVAGSSGQDGLDVGSYKPLDAIYGENVTRDQLVSSLVGQGVYFAQKGELTTFYIATSKLFKPFTSQWHIDASNHIIADISKLINSYDVIGVDISSAVYGARTKRFLAAIAKQQAGKVANAMINSGLDARVVLMHGVLPFRAAVGKGGSLKKQALLTNGATDYGYIKVEFKYKHDYMSR